MFALILLMLVASRPGFAELPPDRLSAKALPTLANPHWVYVVDIVFNHMTDGKIILVDGDTQNVLGMMNTGMSAGLAVAPDKRELYVSETYYSHGTRGERIELVTIYSPSELKPVAEIPIPPKRLLSVNMPYGTILTADGRFLLVFNFTPATSVSVVDVKSRKFVGEVATPGCSLIYPAAKGHRFSMLCSDGRMLTVALDDSGKPVSQKKSDKPLLDADRDSVNVLPGRTRDRFYFVSFLGMVHAVDVSGEEPRFEQPWSLLTEADKAESWRPGGWQYTAANERLNYLYVAMHKGGEGSHKEPGTEIWVFDLKAKKRVNRIALKTPVTGLLTSTDDKPLLYGIGADNNLQVFDAASGAPLGGVQGFADTPIFMVNP